MKFDLHTHHFRCGHAEGSIEDYIRAAIENDLQVIGISDHSPYFAAPEDQAEPGIAMAKSEFPHYVEEVLRLKQKYEGKIEILLGVESDFFPESINLYKRLYDQYPFDYIIGSVHRTDGISIFNRRRWRKLDEAGQIQQKNLYYDLIMQSARSNVFHILGHIDAMKAYYPAFSDLHSDKLEPALKEIAASGVAVEINTSGKTKDVGGWYPSDDILERILHYGGSVTFGSDAHVPERVGDEWDQVRARLAEIGFREWVYFKQKKKITVPL